MSLLQVIVLSLIQGLTEFIPVSSSAHLILSQTFFSWPDQGIAFDVALHVGSLFAVLIYFRQIVLRIIFSCVKFALRKGPFDENCKILLWMFIATIPCGLAGIIFHDFIDIYLHQNWVIGCTTIIFGILLYIAQVANKANAHKNSNQSTKAIMQSDDEVYSEIAKMSLKQVLLVGFAQILALIPGTSRSGITLTAGLFAKVTPKAAAVFSFLLSMPIIFCSGLLEGYKLVTKTNIDGIASISDCVIGGVISFVFSFLVIKIFLDLLNRLGMAPYVIYRIILGIVIFTMIGYGIA